VSTTRCFLQPRPKYRKAGSAWQNVSGSGIWHLSERICSNFVCHFCVLHFLLLFGNTSLLYNNKVYGTVSSRKAVRRCSGGTHLTHRPCPRGLGPAATSSRRLLLGISPRPRSASSLTPDHSVYTSPRPVTAVGARGRRSRGPRHSPRALDTCDHAISTVVETRTRSPTTGRLGQNPRTPRAGLWKL